MWEDRAIPTKNQRELGQALCKTAFALGRLLQKEGVGPPPEKVKRLLGELKLIERAIEKDLPKTKPSLGRATKEDRPPQSLAEILGRQRDRPRDA